MPERAPTPAAFASDDAAEDDFRLELTATSSAVGQDSVKAIRVQYSIDGPVRLGPTPILQDIDDCTFLFFLNKTLAEKIRAIHVYGNEYKLTEIRSGGFRVDETPFENDVPFIFSPTELADPWVRLRPEVASAFHIRFSEQTPKRFVSAQEVANSRVP